MARRSAGEGGFDHVAGYYGVLERLAFGASMQRARTAFLGQIDPRRVLLAGEGEGRLASSILERFDNAELDIVDASEKQLLRAQARVERLGATDRCRFLRADARQLEQIGDIDVIATPFFLDCFEADDLVNVIASLASCAAPRAVWLHADFVPAEPGIRGLRQKAWQHGLYGFFTRSTGLEARRLQRPDRELERHGFELRDTRRFRFGLLHAQIWIRDA